MANYDLTSPLSALEPDQEGEDLDLMVDDESIGFDDGQHTSQGVYQLTRYNPPSSNPAIDEFRSRIMAFLPSPESMAAAQARADAANEEARKQLELAAKYDPSAKYWAFAQATGAPTRTGHFSEGVLNQMSAYLGAEKNEKDRVRDATLRRAEFEAKVASDSQADLANRFRLMSGAAGALSNLEKATSGTMYAPKAAYVQGVGYVEYDPNRPPGQRQRVLIPEQVYQKTYAKFYPSFLKYAMEVLKLRTAEEAEDYAARASHQATMDSINQTSPAPGLRGLPQVDEPLPPKITEAVPPRTRVPTKPGQPGLESQMQIPPEVQAARDQAAATVRATETPDALSKVTPEAIRQAQAKKQPSPRIRQPGEEAGEKTLAQEQAKLDVSLQEAKPKTAALVANMVASSNQVDELIGQAKKQASFWTTGIPGVLGKKALLPWQIDLQETLNSIRANIGFDKVDAMRQMSPTGAAVGQLTEGERATLESTLGSLEQSQSRDQLVQNLERVRKARKAYLDRLKWAYEQVYKEAFPSSGLPGLESAKPSGPAKPKILDWNQLKKK